MKTINKLVALLLCALLAAACFACATKAPATTTTTTAAEDDWAYIKDKGTLVIGITEYAPMNYYDETGKLVGFDTELAEAICASLGVKPEFIVIDWDTKELELSSKKIDCIWNGLTVTEERKANMAFTDSYLANRQVVVVKATDEGQYADLAAFDGKAVVAEGGSAGEAAVAASMAGASYVAVDAQTKALLEVKSGTAVAAVVDFTLVNAMVGAGKEYSDLALLAFEMPNEEYAIGFRVGSSATKLFTDALKALYGDGSFAKLAEKYDLTDLMISAAS